MKSIDDSIIVNQVLQGNESAFTSLVDRYRNIVHGLVYHYVGNFHDAEDITQEVFIKVYRNLNTLTEPDKFSIWLSRIARNFVISWLRQTKMDNIQVSMDTQNMAITSASLQRYENDKLRESIKDTIYSLPENEKMVINLYYLGGATSSEIGKIMDVPSSTVRYWLYRAKQHLKGEFDMVKDELRMKRIPLSFTEQVMDSLGKIEGSVIGIDGHLLGNVKLSLNMIVGRYSIYNSNYIQTDKNGYFAVDLPGYNKHRLEQAEKVEYRIMYFTTCANCFD